MVIELVQPHTAPPQIKFVTGLIHGKLTLLRKLPKSKNVPGVRWKVQCNCGSSEPFIVQEAYLRRKDNPRIDCGCGRKTNKTLFNSEYRIWLMMLRRTTDPTHVSYEDYGGRGIKVCPEWSDWDTGFTAFLAHIGPRPSPIHTVERVNNDQGYQPTYDGKVQVVWATPLEQAQNRRKRVP